MTVKEGEIVWTCSSKHIFGEKTRFLCVITNILEDWDTTDPLVEIGFQQNYSVVHTSTLFPATKEEQMLFILEN